MLYGNAKPWLLDNLFETAVEAINFLLTDESQLIKIIEYLIEINQIARNNSFLVACTTIESSDKMLKALKDSLINISQENFFSESDKITKKIKLLELYYNYFKACNFDTIFSMDRQFLSAILAKLTRFNQDHPLQLDELSRLNMHILETIKNLWQVNKDLLKRELEKEEQITKGLVGVKIQQAESFKYEEPKPYKHEPKKLLFNLKYIKIQNELNHCFLKHKKKEETAKLTEEFENEALEMKVKQHKNIIVIDNYCPKDFLEAKNNLHRFFASKCEKPQLADKNDIEFKLTK